MHKIGEKRKREGQDGDEKREEKIQSITQVGEEQKQRQEIEAEMQENRKTGKKWILSRRLPSSSSPSPPLPLPQDQWIKTAQTLFPDEELVLMTRPGDGPDVQPSANAGGSSSTSHQILDICLRSMWSQKDLDLYASFNMKAEIIPSATSSIPARSGAVVVIPLEPQASESLSTAEQQQQQQQQTEKQLLYFLGMGTEAIKDEICHNYKLQRKFLLLQTGNVFSVRKLLLRLIQQMFPNQPILTIMRPDFLYDNQVIEMGLASQWQQAELTFYQSYYGGPSQCVIETQ